MAGAASQMTSDARRARAHTGARGTTTSPGGGRTAESGGPMITPWTSSVASASAVPGEKPFGAGAGAGRGFGGGQDQRSVRVEAGPVEGHGVARAGVGADEAVAVAGVVDGPGERFGGA